MTRRIPLFLLFALAISFCHVAAAQTTSAQASPAQATAPSPASSDLADADKLYNSGKFADAAAKYMGILKADPNQVDAQVGLIRCLLREQKPDEALAVATAALAAKPKSAALLAAMGDVDFRMAHMHEAEESYNSALDINPKLVDARLGLARIYRAYSLYRQAHLQLEAAHKIAPNDPDVQRRWIGQLSRKERIAAIEAYLAGSHADTPDEIRSMQQYLEYLKATADTPVHACKLVNRVERTDTKLESVTRGPREIVASVLVVKLNDRNVRLELDTGASGILISRRAAEKAGVTRISKMSIGGIGDKGEQGGYFAVADRVRIGELEFHDCEVDVADHTRGLEEDGLIGADVFSSYLIDIDLPNQRLKLSELPKRPQESSAPAALNSSGETSSADESDEGEDEAQPAKPDDKAAKPDDKTAKADEKPARPAEKTAAAAPARRLPQDRYVAPEMEHWTKVFRFGHMLLIPTSIDRSPPMLFAIDTGAMTTSVSYRAAKQVTSTSSDPTTRMIGLSGEVNKVYRAQDANVIFGHMAQRNQSVVTFDLSNLSQGIGTEVSGLLGYTTLRLLQVKIDYRDGLVDFVYDQKRFGAGTKF